MSRLPDRCPRLFVYDLPDEYRSPDWAATQSGDGSAHVGRGIGRPLAESPGHGFRTYDGQQYQMGDHFYQRALGYRCRTHDPSEADLFFVPAYALCLQLADLLKLEELSARLSCCFLSKSCKLYKHFEKFA